MSFVTGPRFVYYKFNYVLKHLTSKYNVPENTPPERRHRGEDHQRDVGHAEQVPHLPKAVGQPVELRPHDRDVLHPVAARCETGLFFPTLIINII